MVDLKLRSSYMRARVGVSPTSLTFYSTAKLPHRRQILTTSAAEIVSCCCELARL